MSPSTKRRRMALLYIRTAQEVLEEEEHDGPHPLGDVLGKLRDAEKTLEGVLRETAEEGP